MNNNLKLLILILIAIVGVLLIVWLFNICAYYFWLAGQQIANHEAYLHRLYLSGAVFLLSIALEVFVIYKTIKLK